MAGKKKADSKIKFNPNDWLPRLGNQSANHIQKTGRVRMTADAGPSFQFTLPMPYQPEFASAERVQWPIDRLQQNRYWRLFYKTDPVISTVVDLYSEIIASDFQLAGEGIDGSIKDTYEYMIEKTNIVSLFKYFVTEFLVMGEVIPHLVFDEKNGIWDKLIFHNPDQIKVIDSPFVAMDPVLEFTPDETLRALSRSTNPTIIKWMSSLPAEVQDAIISGRNIPLDTTLNTTFLARKVHPYDVRGTSIFTRLYRILMYEDAVANASIATARRHAGPLKIAKLGDKDLRWVPEKEYQDKIIELLTIAEQDPHSFLILPWFVNFEAFGTTDKMMNIGREWDIIERIKLTALGVSQGFLHGEATYSSMRGNMQTLLMKMSGLRQYFESSWFIPKFFRPIAEMNKWIKKPKKSDTKGGNYRRKKGQTTLEDAQDYIIPDIKWSRALGTKIDEDLMAVYEQIVNRLGIPLSKKTVFPAAGLDYDLELENLAQEKLDAQNKAKEKGVSEQTITGKEPEEVPGGVAGGGGGETAPAEGGGEGEEGGEVIPLTPVEEGGEATPEGASKQSVNDLGLNDDEFDDLVDLITSGKSSPFWKPMLRKGETEKQFINDFDWTRVVDYLDEEGFKPSQIMAVKNELIHQGVIEMSRDEYLDKLVSNLTPEASDMHLDRVTDAVIKSGLRMIRRKDVNDLLLGSGNIKNSGVRNVTKENK